MRAQHGRRARGDASSFWISYSDLMASMLFVFALILFFSILQTFAKRLECEPARIHRMKGGCSQPLLIITGHQLPAKALHKRSVTGQD